MQGGLEDQIRGLIGQFEDFYFRVTIRQKAAGQENLVTFEDFISDPKYTSIYRRLVGHVEEKGISLYGLIFESLTEEQKRRIGPLFHETSYGAGQMSENQVNLLEKHILNSKEYRDYRNFSSFLTEEQNEKLASKLSQILYDRLDDKAKKSLNTRSILTYMMNLGFVRVSRVTHREAIDFVKSYPSMFQGSQDVLNHIMERYVDEELANTPIKDTKQRIAQLKNEVMNLYREVLHGP